MNTPTQLIYLRHAFNHEAHPDSRDHDPKDSCVGCIWAVDDQGEEYLLWSIAIARPRTFVIHHLDPRYPNRADYGDIEVLGLNEKETADDIQG